ncbi:DUF4097 family beta strand repeat-containing protein [Halobacillus salinus]|uniref:DUF4097 domain-containing protein n=1 Tax=Halobacillus salinus TaxID=192814 RepID=A0A4Z0GW64_9BACI|nr:DUF4097 family beta strand repeat-containing protein [Halobacillus salinus]TGB01237.1 hypothetical protein E4663_17330 [Halobacillus salinus]
MKMTLIIAVLLITIGIIGFITTQSTNVLSFNTTTLDEKKTLPAEGIKHIDVTTSYADIEVAATSSEDIQVALNGKVSNKKDTLHVERKGDQLFIEFPEEQNGVSFSLGGQNHAQLKVLLPERGYDAMNLDSSSGDIEVQGMSLFKLTTNSSSGDQALMNNEVEETIQLASSSGSIRTKKLRAHHISVDTSSGDVINHGTIAEKSEANTSSGSVKWLEHEEDTDITVQTSSGDTEISLRDEPLSTSLLYTSSSGEASIKHAGFSFTEVSDDRINGTIGDGEAKIRVDSSSGDFRLQ